MAAGSEAALETIYDRYASAIFAAAYRLTSDRGTAEEVVQETFLALWNRAESFDAAAGSLAAWLHTIARNRAIDRLRAAGRRPSLVALSSAAGLDEDPTQALERLVSGGSVVASAVAPAGPEEAYEAVGRREAIAAAGGWSAATLTEDLDLSYRDIAAQFGISIGTATATVTQALKKIRAHIEANPEELKAWKIGS